MTPQPPVRPDTPPIADTAPPAATPPPADGPGPIPQPFLHDLVTCVSAPTVVLSAADGQIRPGGTQGAFRHDKRVLSELVLHVDGHEPVPVGGDQPGAGAARFIGVVRHLGDPSADPTVRIERARHTTASGMREQIRLVNASRQAITATVRLRAATDFAPMDPVRHGEPTPAPVPAEIGPQTTVWAGESARTTVQVSPAASQVVGPDGRLELSWQVTVGPRQSWSTTLDFTLAGQAGPEGHTFAPAQDPSWLPVTATGPRDLVRLLRRGLDDLEALRLADPRSPGDIFAAAGSPWFLTLFGRDSIWAARFTLPLGTDLARGTLRALASRQGTRHDPETAEAPGKIPHEVRSQSQRITGDKFVYFGTVDATALWVCLLHDAWRWGMPEAEVAELLDPLEAALRWLVEDADSDGDGFLEYLDQTGHGLANQGWKDSGDSIQFPDGTIAEPPIALSEAQAYAYEAARCGATLLETFGRPGAQPLRDWAEQLRSRFREAFWVHDARGRFPAIALDGSKRPVDVASSNLGHLLGTGLLTAEEAAEVAARLAEPDLDCGYGLRTMSADAVGFNPLAYHAGSVWPHDTAIAVHGLSRAGHAQVASSLAEGLLRAAPDFAYRLPELFGGTDARSGQSPLVYPASCRPQAWSAAAVVPLLQAALGLDADVPQGTLTVRPRPEFADWFPLRIEGLRIAGVPMAVSVDADGHSQVLTDAPVEVRVQTPVPRPRTPRGEKVSAGEAGS